MLTAQHTSQTNSEFIGERFEQEAIESAECSARNDGSMSDHDSIDLEPQYAERKVSCSRG
jgi:hypothetical protein